MISSAHARTRWVCSFYTPNAVQRINVPLANRFVGTRLWAPTQIDPGSNFGSPTLGETKFGFTVCEHAQLVNLLPEV